MKIHRYGIHRGEEQYVKGNSRAGMIVLAGCHLRCSFCYTPEASFERQGEFLDLGRVLDELAEQGALNFNFISPTHVWNEIRGPLKLARQRHPQIPVVLKVSGYEGERLAREFAQSADVVVMDYKVFHEDAAKAVNLPVPYGKIASRFLKRLLPLKPFTQNALGEIESGILVRTLWLPAAPNEAIAIGQELERLGFDGAWNLMRHFIDPVGKRLLSAPKSWEAEATQSLRAAPGFEVWHGGKRAARMEQAV
jgi:putative pyruvate formate lyase activating enzyme